MPLFFDLSINKKIVHTAIQAYGNEKEVDLTDETFTMKYQKYSTIYEKGILLWIRKTALTFPANTQYQQHYVKDMMKHAKTVSEKPESQLILLCALERLLGKNIKRIKNQEIDVQLGKNGTPRET